MTFPSWCTMTHSMDYTAVCWSLLCASRSRRMIDQCGCASRPDPLLTFSDSHDSGKRGQPEEVVGLSGR